MSLFASEYDQERHRDAARSYRKVELQSPDDLTYLIAKLSRTARDKIDKHFPPDAAPQGEDWMKAQVEMYVDEYIRQTYSLAKANMSINGMDPVELESELAKTHDGEDFEPFDAKLAYRIQDLSRDIEERTLALAELRRDAPAATASKYRAAVDAEDKTLGASLETFREERLAQASNTKLKLDEIARLDTIDQTWHDSNDKLARLTAEIDQTIMKAEQAERAQQYVAGT